jgi:hypothetical protein
VDSSKQETSKNSPPPVHSLEQEPKRLKIVLLSSLMSIPLYFVIARSMGRIEISKWWLGVPAAFLLLDLLRAPGWIRELRSIQADLAKEPQDNRAFARYRLLSIRFLVMGLTLGVLGFLFQILGHDLMTYVPCYLAGAAVILIPTTRLLYRSSR